MTFKLRTLACPWIQWCPHPSWFFNRLQVPALASSLRETGSEALRLHSRLPTGHAWAALRFVICPAVFCDLWSVPEGLLGKEGVEPPLRSSRWSYRDWGRGYLSNSGTRSPVKKKNNNVLTEELPLTSPSFSFFPPLTWWWYLDISDARPSSGSSIDPLRSSHARLQLHSVPPCFLWHHREALWLLRVQRAGLSMTRR